MADRSIVHLLNRAEKAIDDTKTSINAAVVIGIVALAVATVALVVTLRTNHA